MECRDSSPGSRGLLPRTRPGGRPRVLLEAHAGARPAPSRVALVAALEAGPASRSGRVAWGGRDATGRPLPSGVYFLRLTSGGTTVVRKVTLLR